MKKCFVGKIISFALMPTVLAGCSKTITETGDVPAQTTTETGDVVADTAAEASTKALEDGRIVRLYYSNVDYKGEIDGEVVDDIFDGLIYAG